jgi:hypothetical protein
VFGTGHDAAVRKGFKAPDRCGSGELLNGDLTLLVNSADAEDSIIPSCHNIAIRKEPHRVQFLIRNLNRSAFPIQIV